MAESEKNYNISAKSAGTFLGAAVVALVLGLANTLGSSSNDADNQGSARLDELEGLVRANSEAIRTGYRDTQNLWEHHREVEVMLEDHLDFSVDKVNEITQKFAELKTWEVGHEQRESFQDQMISDCIRTLRARQ